MSATRTGYTLTNDSRLAWIPPGWPHTPPHVIGPHETPEAAQVRQYAHARRQKTGVWHTLDWPPCLVAYHPSRRPNPWRCITFSASGSRTASWHETRKLALAHGTPPMQGCIT